MPVFYIYNAIQIIFNKHFENYWVCVCVCGWWIGNFAVDDLEFQKKTHKVHIFV